jgi:hypothetical protein
LSTGAGVVNEGDSEGNFLFKVRRENEHEVSNALLTFFFLQEGRRHLN